MLKRRGHSLVEALVAVALVAVLATIAFPAFTKVLHAARRGDAIELLLEVQQAQERWRSNRPAYASLEELGIAAHAAQVSYRLAVLSAGATGYVLVAEAMGAQAGDVPCRFMRLSMSDAQTTLASGPDAAVRNGAAANRKCWRL